MIYFMDIECYKNYFLVKFKSEKGEYFEFEKLNNSPLDIAGIKRILRNNTIITFNGLHYDVPVLAKALQGANNAELKSMTDSIIQDDKRYWITPEYDHIDIKEVAPGVAVSLKLYGGRLHAETLQDLPIEHTATITAEQAKRLSIYCSNDLDTTEQLYHALNDDITLRQQLSDQYGIDVRSKSDAQIAEAIFGSYLEDAGVTVRKRSTEVKPFKYRVPDWIEFSSPEFKQVLETVRNCTFTVNATGNVVLPVELDKAIEFAGSKYKFGIGGLHSQEKKLVTIASPDQCLGEFDISSMYPSIIIEQKLYPAHLTKQFLKIYTQIKEERVKAKATDPAKAQTYKIMLNGSYGKFGSKYSYLYSPELLIQTTITGQLFLLMAIEKVTAAGGKVVSANTDGINVLYSKAQYDDIHTAIFECELLAGYDFEYTPYKATYNRDVNNYIAVCESGKVKSKGEYAIGGLMKNPQNEIVSLAVIAHLTKRADISQFIRSCDDVTKFVTIRTVKGGAEFNGEYVGKVVRFYHSTDSKEAIRYKKKEGQAQGNKVPKSDGCKPLMQLPDSLPTDIDYDWYIKEADKQLKDLGL